MISKDDLYSLKTVGIAMGIMFIALLVCDYYVIAALCLVLHLICFWLYRDSIEHNKELERRERRREEAANIRKAGLFAKYARDIGLYPGYTEAEHNRYKKSLSSRF